MYDELINLLRRCGKQKCKNCEYEHVLGCVTKMNEKAADAIEELSMKLHGDEATILGMKREIERMVVNGTHSWIPVAERLPKEKTYVLILADTIAGKMEKVSFLYKDSEGRNCWTALDVYGKNPFDWQPTHWMPLPSTEGLDET